MGTLIALEGIDGSGKSTQACWLRDRLEASGRPVAVFREPGDTEFGDRLREIFRGDRDVSREEEMRLFVEDRRIDVHDNILPALAQGKVVLMDRYYFSTMAYQGALGIDPEEIRAVNEAFAPRPHLTLILDLPAEVGAERIRAARGSQDSFEGVEYLKRVRELFLSFATDDVRVIDAVVEPEVVGGAIWRQVEAFLERRGGSS